MDEEYAAYYDQLFDALLANGITPMICLEHYELPGYLLEKYGGWGAKTGVDIGPAQSIQIDPGLHHNWLIKGKPARHLRVVAGKHLLRVAHKQLNHRFRPPAAIIMTSCSMRCWPTASRR